MPTAARNDNRRIIIPAAASALLLLAKAAGSTGFVPPNHRWRRPLRPPSSPLARCQQLTSPSTRSTSFAAANDDAEGVDVDVDAAERQRRRDEDRAASALLFAAVPAVSLALPALLEAQLYGPLAIAKRACVYGMACAIAAVAASRGAEDDPNLGRRLEALTAEALPRPTPPLPGGEEEEDARFRELRALDGVDSNAQSAALPLIVASSLALSVFLLRLRDGDFAADISAGGAGELDALVASLLDRARVAAPSVVGLSNAAVLGLFARAELDRAVRAWLSPAAANGVAEEAVAAESDAEVAAAAAEPPPVATPLALALVASAYLLPPNLAWPFRNAASMSLGVAVSRAVQLPRLGPIAAALTALVLYDVFSVGVALVDLGSATLAVSEGAAGASAGAEATAAAAAASSSAMGAVALSKVGGAAAVSGGDAAATLWQPGLLEVRLRGRATDLLGLGDAVFPSLLATFALRFDRRRKEEGGGGESAQEAARPPRYFAASLLGFAAGCLACERVPGIDSSGLPALLFIVPSMFAAVLGLAAIRGDLAEIWKFDPAGDADVEGGP